MHSPAKHRSAPELHLGWQLGALLCCAHADAEHLRAGHVCRITGWTTVRTKRLHASPTAFACFHINLRLAGEQFEPFAFGRNHNAKGRARQRLAISAMAYGHRIGIDLGFVTDRPTMT